MTAVDSEKPPLLRPPELTTGEPRSTSRLELFFDLAYVLCVAELAMSLLSDLDWDGVWEFVALFTVVWLSWAQYTLHNNRFDTDDLILRFAKLGAMLAILGAAASMSGATGDKVVPFTCSYALGRVILAGLYYRAWRHVPAARGTTTVYLVAMTAVAALWLISLAVPAPLKFVLWSVAGVVDVAAPIVAGRRQGRAPLHLEHLPDRFGLLVILVLGEVIASIVTGVHDAKWATVSVVIAVAGFLIAAALWWAYFDVGGTVSAHAIQRADEEESGARSPRDRADDDAVGSLDLGLGSDEDGQETPTDDRDAAPGVGRGEEPHSELVDESDREPVDERHDLFIYGHLPLTAGILAVAVGIEELVLHPDRSLPSSGSLLVTSGIVAFLLGAGVLLRGGEQKSRLSVAWPAVAATAVLLWGLLGPRDALAFSAGAAVLITAAAAAGAVISRRTPGKVHRPLQQTQRST
ncbi:MAG TPA: low temperature requirement protein A [Lapillicoccus sp.]